MDPAFAEVMMEYSASPSVFSSQHRSSNRSLFPVPRERSERFVKKNVLLGGEPQGLKSSGSPIQANLSSNSFNIKRMEAGVGIEPTHRAFAELGFTT